MDRNTLILGKNPEISEPLVSEAVLMDEIARREELLQPLTPFTPATRTEEMVYHAGHLAGSAVWDSLKKSAEIEELQHERHHDELTGLSNAVALGAKLRDLIDHDKAFGFAFLDINDFKKYNDNQGHAAADKVLVKLGEHLKAAYKRDDDTVLARIHGDEFAIIFMLGSNREREADPIKGFSVGRDYLRGVLQDFEDETGVGIAAGIVPYDPSNPCEPEEILELGDHAMYRTKAAEKAAKAAQH